MMKPKTKRTHTLKEIMQRQKAIVKDISNAGNPNLLINIKEDLLQCDTELEQIKVTENIDPKQSIDLDATMKAIAIFEQCIEKEVIKTAKLLGITEAQLHAWIDLQIEVPAHTIFRLLRICCHHQLDPFKEEITLTQQDDFGWQALITIEGWSKIINTHAQFNGLSFTNASQLIGGVPEWTECAIYRKDRILPTIVREYFLEVRSDHETWKKMPRRMLRHRALQQCARLAF